MDLKGHLDVIDKKGTCKEKLVALAYCVDCDIYYILEDTYLELKKQGIICGTIMTKKEFLEHKDLNTAYWKEKSPLKLIGYSVSKEDDLSTEQRWAILERIVDTGIMTLDKELSYLDFLLNGIITKIAFIAGSKIESIWKIMLPIIQGMCFLNKYRIMCLKDYLDSWSFSRYLCTMMENGSYVR